jgi:hypothetical protein
LDDNRIYRLTEAPPKPVTKKTPKKTPKKNTKAYRAGVRASKRRKVSGPPDHIDTSEFQDDMEDQPEEVELESDGLGGMRWECIAVTLDQVQTFLQSLQKTRDGNEKILRDTLEEHLVPILERQEESRKRKAVQREKELLNLAKIANAKRSSRIANKIEQQKLDEKTREEDERRLAEEAAALREAKQRSKLEEERDLRLMSREKRLKERQARRLQHEEELAQLSEDSKSLGSGTGRVSERRLQAEIEKNKQALQELDEEEEDWIFDCVCGAYGQVDDGSHSIACERCNVWQHSKCVGVAEKEAELEAFHFICASCRRREEEARSRPKHARIKLKVNRPGSSQSQMTADTTTNSMGSSQQVSGMVVEIHTSRSQPLFSSPLPAQGVFRPPAPVKAAALPKSSSPVPPRPSSAHSSANGIAGYKVPSPRVVFTSPQHHAEPSHSPGKQPQYRALQPRPIEIVNGSSQSMADKRTEESPKASASEVGNVVVITNGHGVAQLPPRSPALQEGRAYVGATPNSSTVTRNGQIGLQTPSIGYPRAMPQTFPANDNTPEPLQSLSGIPSEGGISPIKHSPPLPSGQSTSSRPIGSTPIIPPVTMLAPSPSQLILTPPIKQSEGGMPSTRY